MRNLINKINNRKGSVTIIMAVVLAVLMAVMAYVVDVGMIYAEGIKLSNALDAAVLAGAMELPGDPGEAINIANQYLINNDVDLNEVTIVIGEDNKA